MMKTKLDSILQELRDGGWECGLSRDWCEDILDTGIRSKNAKLAIVATEIAHDENPLTLRGLFYRVVSAGWLPSTDQTYYSRLGRLMTRLREERVIPFWWLVDNVRSTLKPSSWSGLADFVETVRDAYRKDFWERLPHYVHIFVEKDAIAGTVQPVTHEYDVPLSPIRGYASLSYVHEIATHWNRIDKPIFAYYLGDFDPSGFDLERDLCVKLGRYCNKVDWYAAQGLDESPPQRLDGTFILWHRLGVNADDFDRHDLIPLEAKRSDRRYRTFIEEHGDQCAELDALPPGEIRRRVRDAITEHIPSDEWSRLQEIEETERQSFNAILDHAS